MRLSAIARPRGPRQGIWAYAVNCGDRPPNPQFYSLSAVPRVAVSFPGWTEAYLKAGGRVQDLAPLPHPRWRVWWCRQLHEVLR